MKKLIFTAALAVAAFTSNAQDDFVNNTNCDLRIRAVCIDETAAPFTCFATTTVSGWISLPANTTTSFAAIAGLCAAPLSQGYEVDYAVSTGCSGNSKLFTTSEPNNSCQDGFPAWANPVGLSTCSCTIDNDNPNPRAVVIFPWFSPGSSLFVANN